MTISSVAAPVARGLSPVLRLATMLALLVALAACGSGSSTATGDITVTGAWVRVTTADQPAGGYFVIANASAEADALTSVSSPAFGSVQMHETVMMTAEPGQSGSGMMGMQPVSEIAVPADGTVALEPGGYHLMLMEPTGAIAPGDTVELTLTFRNADPIIVSAVVKGA